jgi:restriction system protein
MPVPNFQSFLLPLLRLMADGKDHAVADLRNHVQEAVGLSDADLLEKIPSGTQSKFANRLTWASVYLTKAGALRRLKRGVFQITDRGRDLLKENQDGITVKTLARYPEFLEFHRGNSVGGVTAGDIEQDPGQTPEERLAAVYGLIRSSLAADLLETVKRSSPGFFERLVIDLLVAMGYGGSEEDAARAVGGTGDGGIDGMIKEDKLGLDAVYVQAKRWNGTVGRPAIQAFAGSLEGQRARKGIFITTSDFSQDALDYAQRIEKRIVLINGRELAELMIDHNVGVEIKGKPYTVKKIDQDYFEED